MVSGCTRVRSRCTRHAERCTHKTWQVDYAQSASAGFIPHLPQLPLSGNQRAHDILAEGENRTDMPSKPSRSNPEKGHRNSIPVDERWNVEMRVPVTCGSGCNRSYNGKSPR